MKREITKLADQLAMFRDATRSRFEVRYIEAFLRLLERADWKSDPVEIAGISQEKIATEMGVGQAIISRGITEFTEAGFLKAVPDPEDRKRNVYILTPQGQRFLRNLLE